MSSTTNPWGKVDPEQCPICRGFVVSWPPCCHTQECVNGHHFPLGCELGRTAMNDADEIHALRCDRASILKELAEVKSELRSYKAALEGLQAEHDALAAHVERLQRVIRKVSVCADYATRSILHEALKETPETCLSRLKAQWQAEALEQAADELGNNAGGEIDYSDVMTRAGEYRRQAEEGEQVTDQTL